MKKQKRNESGVTLACPLCGCGYAGTLAPDVNEPDGEVMDDGPALYLNLTLGSICGNQAMTGPTPHLCSSAHPCPGRLELSKGSRKRLGLPPAKS